MRTRMGTDYKKNVQNMALQGDLDAFLSKVLDANSTSHGGDAAQIFREDVEALSRFDFKTLECGTLVGVYYITRMGPFRNNA